VGEAKPAWKVIRVLGNMFALPGFAYLSSEDVLQELKSYVSRMANRVEAFEFPTQLPERTQKLVRIGSYPIYATDALVRRSAALQKTALMENQAVIRINSNLANELNLSEASQAKVKQSHGQELILPLVIDDKIADHCVWIPSGLPETALLGEAFGTISLSKA
jgi:NADH-quinone oxidoreductase subunit G